MTVMPVARRLIDEVAGLSRRQEGQAMVEYALLLSLVTLVALVAVQAFGHGVAALYTNIVAKYPHG